LVGSSCFTSQVSPCQSNCSKRSGRSQPLSSPFVRLFPSLFSSSFSSSRIKSVYRFPWSSRTAKFVLVVPSSQPHMPSTAPIICVLVRKSDDKFFGEKDGRYYYYYYYCCRCSFSFSSRSSQLFYF